MIWQHPQTLLPNNAGASEVLRLLNEYPPKLPQYAYGTAGFRYDAKVMDAVLVRVAVFCAYYYPQLQKANQQQPNTIGIMVTASHNDESYNGVKLVEPNGEILADAAIQGQLTDWVNSDNAENTSSGVHPIRQWLEKSASTSSEPSEPSCIIHIGYDTRSHSPVLAELATKVIQALGGQVLNHGVATTPLLHHVVLHQNPQNVPSMIPIRPNAVGYYSLLAWSYLALLQTSPPGQTATKQLVVDCACGVGYRSMEMFQKTLQSLIDDNQIANVSPRTRFCCINGPEDGPLNEKCGSEHVQKTNSAPQCYQSSGAASSDCWDYSAALDGDADRIVFFSAKNKDDKESFFLLDGDKITVLICDFLQSEVADLERACQEHPSQGSLGKLTLGAVQTAYANGASTKYLKNVLGAKNVLIAKTGVQHVHHAAKQFDIGVYFEANGHGTVVFSAAFYSYLAQAEALFMSAGVSLPISLQRLRVLPSLVNQAVGDAISDVLLVDAILHVKGWNLYDWKKMYHDHPSITSKIVVSDRTIVKTNENDTICLAPAKVQEELNNAMKEYCGRAFVRPSGTEDVVRVYAEAQTQEAADKLAAKAKDIVFSFCGGVGDPPVSRM